MARYSNYTDRILKPCAVDLLHTNSRCIGLACLCPCIYGPQNMNNTAEHKQAFKKGTQNGSETIDTQPEGLSGRGGGQQKRGNQGGGAYVQHITDDAREDEMDDNLGYALQTTTTTDTTDKTDTTDTTDTTTTTLPSIPIPLTPLIQPLKLYHQYQYH